jgi:hypothetical protein
MKLVFQDPPLSLQLLRAIAETYYKEQTSVSVYLLPIASKKAISKVGTKSG